jgi:hypothetical protein
MGSINYSKFLPSKEPNKKTTTGIDYSKFLPKTEKKVITLESLKPKKVEPITKERTVTLGPQFGGGQYKTAGPGTLPKSDRSQDALLQNQIANETIKFQYHLAGHQQKKTYSI